MWIKTVFLPRIIIVLLAFQVSTVLASEPDRTGWKEKAANAYLIKNFDKRWELPMDTTQLENAGHVTTLYDGKTLSSSDDGLYIFVYLSDSNGANSNKFLIRRSDRPDDKGFFIDGNKAAYSYTGNPPNDDEKPHMFVRHTQLTYGTSGHPGKVWSAGQLEIRHGKIIWVSTASGHYRPGIETLDYVETTLKHWHLWREATAKYDHQWRPNKTNAPLIPTEAQCP